MQPDLLIATSFRIQARAHAKRAFACTAIRAVRMALVPLPLARIVAGTELQPQTHTVPHRLGVGKYGDSGMYCLREHPIGSIDVVFDANRTPEIDRCHEKN